MKATAVTVALLGVLAGPAGAQDAEMMGFAKRILAGVQHRSFAANREFCGTIAVTRRGRLIASRPRRGQRDGCTPRDPWGFAEVIASYHTHAGFDPQADSEVPSAEDLRSDMAEGIDGWVATPGGRLWFNDGRRGETRLVCGPGCLPSDPAFADAASGPIRNRYTLRQLVVREAGR